MAGDSRIDEFGLSEILGNISSTYAADCLKPISDTLDMSVIAGVQQVLRTQIAFFLTNFEKEHASVNKVLSGKKVYQRFSKPATTLEERCERIAFILPTERERPKQLRLKKAPSCRG